MSWRTQLHAEFVSLASVQGQLQYFRRGGLELVYKILLQYKYIFYCGAQLRTSAAISCLLVMTAAGSQEAGPQRDDSKGTLTRYNYHSISEKWAMLGSVKRTRIVRLTERLWALSNNCFNHRINYSLAGKWILDVLYIRIDTLRYRFLLFSL